MFMCFGTMYAVSIIGMKTKDKIRVNQIKLNLKQLEPLAELLAKLIALDLLKGRKIKGE